MHDSGRKSCGAQAFSHGFGGIDRAVSPAGTAEGDVDIGLALRRIARQQHQQQVTDPREGIGKSRVAHDVFAHRRVLPGLFAQGRHPVRIVEKAHVEHEVGQRRRAAREAEEILEKAQAQSAELFEQAKAEAARIIEEAELAAEKAKSLLKIELDAIRNRHRDENH